VLIETWKMMDDLQKRVSELEGQRTNNGDTAA
jgi:hypothetical protein